jgi:hypothetical protein
MRLYWWALAVILVLTLWPFAPVLLANGLAAAGHCAISESGPTPCALFGGDWGGPLWAMASLIRVAFFTVPAGATLLFFWLVTLIVSLSAHARRRGGSNPARAGGVNLGWYVLALAVIAALGYGVLMGWLPGAVLFLVIFAAIFWLFSFVFVLYAMLRRSRIKP